MTKYSELLRDPRWQKKRLEIMQRDEFTCQNCMDSESTLNVHHCYYAKEKMPWDYPDSSLVTLCENCHQTETDNAYDEKKTFIEVLCMLGLLSSHFNSLMSTIYDGIHRGDLPLCNGPSKDVFCSALGWAVCNQEMRATIEVGYFNHLERQRNKWEEWQEGMPQNG